MAQGRDPHQNENRAVGEPPQDAGEGTSAHPLAQNRTAAPPVPAPSMDEVRLAIQEGVRAAIQELRGVVATPNHVGGTQGLGRDDHPRPPQDRAVSEGSRRGSAFDRLGVPGIHQRLGDQTRGPAHSRLRQPLQREVHPREPRQDPLPDGRRQGNEHIRQGDPAKEGSDQTEGGDEAISKRRQGSVHHRLGAQGHLGDPPLPTTKTPAVVGSFIPGFGSHSPFVPRIALQPIPKGIKMPKFKSYDGTIYPKSHITKYEIAMEAYVDDEALCCKAFVSTLEGVASTWFSDLPKASIESWAELKEAFITRFYASSDLQKRP
jgi:hypothetical protein